jgi:hypothetical protein
MLGKWIGSTVRGLVLVGLLSAAAGCAAGTPTPEWVVVDQDIDTDSIVISSGATQAPVVPDEVSLADAEARLPFAVALPSAMPAGFVQDELVEVVAPEDAEADDYASLIVSWENADEATVRLQVSTTAAGAPAVGSVGSGQAVTVKGQPATLQQTQGLGPERVTLTWQTGGLDYRLTASGGALTGDDLLAMAESIP